MATIIGKIRKKETKKSELTIAEIKAKLDELGVEYDKKAKKEDLVTLLYEEE